MGTDIMEEARDSSLLGHIPGFTHGNKSKALDEIIAKLPEESKAEGRADKRTLLWVSQQFSPSARSNKDSRWSVKGLKTGLFHHQVSSHQLNLVKTLISHSLSVLRSWYVAFSVGNLGAFTDI